MAAVQGQLALFSQVQRADIAPQADGPGRLDHALGGLGGGELLRSGLVGIGGEGAVVHDHLGLAAHEQRAAAHALVVDLGVVDGQLRIAGGGDSRAHADKVVGAVAGQLNDGVIDLILRVAGEVEAVEVPLLRLDADALSLLVGDGAALNGGGDRAAGHQLAVVHDDTGVIVADGLLAEAERAAGEVVANGDAHIALVHTGGGSVGHAVHGEGEVLALRRGDGCAGGDGQGGEGGGLFHRPDAAFHDFRQFRHAFHPSFLFDLDRLNDGQ